MRRPREQVLALRTQIAKLAAGGLRQHEIAEMLHIAPSTVSKHLAIVREEWQAERLDAIDEQLRADLARIEEAIRAIWPQVLTGRGWAIGRLVELLELKGRWLGYERVRHDGDFVRALETILDRLARMGAE
jgi:DNA-binding MarR family transcriptional regulator